MDTDSSLQFGSPSGEPNCRLNLCLDIRVNLRLSRFALWATQDKSAVSLIFN